MNESTVRTLRRRVTLTVASVVAVLVVALAGCSGATSTPTPTPTPTPNAGAAGCLISDQQCLGALKPGRYSSVLFDPYASGKPGQFSYTAPEGWANSADLTFGYSLQPAVSYLAGDKDHWGSVNLAPDPGAARQDGSCDATSAPGGATDAAGIAASLEKIPGLTVTKLPSEKVAGKTAIVLETSVDPTAIAKACHEGSVSLFASRDAGDPWVYSTDVTEGLRIYLVDLDATHAIAICVNSPKADFAQLAEAAKPLIASFRFASAG